MKKLTLKSWPQTASRRSNWPPRNGTGGPNFSSPGEKYGYRSGLEDKIAQDLLEAGVGFEYEAHVIRYTKPEKGARYTPDFLLANGIIVETKGRFLTPDRQKMLLVKAQHPDLDIRFVFSNSKTRIGKKSKTTYAMWCEKNGFLYADKDIPAAWLQEPIKPCSLRNQSNG